MNVVIAADIDVSRPFGDTGRTLAFATGLQARGYQVALIAPPPKEPETMIATDGLRLEFIPVKQVRGSLYNMACRMWSLVQRAKKLCRKNNAILMVETSQLGGYFALLGAKDYILDMHGINFDEVAYARLPWYIPRKAYARFVKYVEKKGLMSASRVIAVSLAMADFLKNKLHVDPAKISIIPNGYFAAALDKIVNMGCQEEDGAVIFVGLLEKWAAVDKVMRAADVLRDEKATFYIVGDGPHREELEMMKEQLALDNVIFTGKVPLHEAYAMIARSEIALLPFPKTIATEVACPIKVIEYMALGKAMIIDDVSDLSHLLKDHEAALMGDPDREQEFVGNIKLLLYGPEMRKRIGDRARALAENYSWDLQVEKLHKILTANWEKR